MATSICFQYNHRSHYPRQLPPHPTITSIPLPIKSIRVLSSDANGDQGIEGSCGSGIVDFASVNNLFRLDDDDSTKIPYPESTDKLSRHTLEVLDNLPSFGSACSTPSINNLSLIRTRPEGNRWIVGINGQFRCMNLSSAVTEGQEMTKNKGFVAPHFSHSSTCYCLDN